ncbi:MAG: hypothetical protein CMM58_03395 [Rhodospirillaceae bacterium]|nr:hypothetical protein [Rhodospirillaceae bacterium]
MTLGLLFSTTFVVLNSSEPLALDSLSEVRILQKSTALENNINKLKTKSGTGIEMFYDPVRDEAGSTNGEPYNQADREWVETCLILYDLYRQLGGEKLNNRILFQQKEDLFLIALENTQSAWHETPDLALIDFFQKLLNQSVVLSPMVFNSDPTKTVSPAKLNLQSRISSLVNPLHLPNKLAFGEVVTLMLPNSDIAITAPQLRIRDYRSDLEGLSATITPAEVSKPGRQFVYGFSAKRKFRPVSKQIVTITDYSNNRRSTYGVSNKNPKRREYLHKGLTNRIKNSGGAKRFKILLPSSTHLHIRSEGPTDLIGFLTDSKGKVISIDDDSGLGYNFALQAKLTSGNYVLTVKHCCAGTGPFKLKIDKKLIN